MTATSCPDENALGLLAEARLGDDERRTLEQHLDGCASCSRLVGELARLAPTHHAVPERYTILRRLGAGGMGVVWEAEDRQLGRKVALKWLLPDPDASADADRARRARLYREARALAQLRHPNVLTVHEVGEVDGEVFLVLELVEGTTARAWRDAAPRTPEEILAVWRQVGAGLAAVHRAGIVHRDVKPDNVLVAGDGRVLLGDFGLATARAGDPASVLTGTGQVLGTPLYMAPEQLHGEPATVRSDQFALCVCLWEALGGARPFSGATAAALAVAILRSPPVPAHVDRRQFATLARGLAADPAARWPEISALLDALTAPPRGRRRAAIGAGVLALGVVVSAAWYATRRSAPESSPVASYAPRATVAEPAPIAPDVAIASLAAPPPVAPDAAVASPAAPQPQPPAPRPPPIRTPPKPASAGAGAARHADTYHRHNAIASMDAWCHIPYDAAHPDPSLAEPIMDWGAITRVEQVAGTVADVPVTVEVFEVAGQRGRYRVKNDFGVLGYLDHARPGDLLALCPAHDDNDPRDPAGGPLTSTYEVVPLSGPPRLSELARLAPRHITALALQVAVESGRLAPGAYLVHAQIGPAEGDRFKIERYRWWIDVAPDAVGARQIATGTWLWLVVDDSRFEPQAGETPRPVLRVTAAFELFP